MRSLLLVALALLALCVSPAAAAPQLPATVEFCGERLDLTDPTVRAPLEQALQTAIADRDRVHGWLERSALAFPAVEAEAAGPGLCADLKYLAVVRGGLDRDARPTAQWWSAVADTGEQYGLHLRRTALARADRRYDARGELAWLRSLHGTFGSWLLAVSAYDAGPQAVRQAMRARGADGFMAWHLRAGTDRLVMRAVAAKVVMSRLEHYGFRRPGAADPGGLAAR